MPVRTFNEHKSQHVDFTAKVNVGLHDNFISTPKPVIVVNFHAAEIYLQGAINVSKIYAEHFNFLLIEFVFITGRSHAESCRDALKFGTRISRLNNFIGYIGKYIVRVTFQINKLHCQAAYTAETG